MFLKEKKKYLTLRDEFVAGLVERLEKERSKSSPQKRYKSFFKKDIDNS